jgi:thiol-disulfide isomerase/thioredoxin
MKDTHGTRTHHRLWRTALAAAILIAPGLALRAADAPPTTAPGWIENAALTLRVMAAAPTPDAMAGTGGEVFDRTDYQSILLVPADGDLAYVLDLARREATPYPKTAILGDDGSPRMPAAVSTRPAAAFDIAPDGTLHFTDAGQQFFVQAAAPLTGPLTRATLDDRQPGYARRARLYRPDAATVARLAAARLPAEIVVFFGTWCRTCKHDLPALLATLDAAKNPNLRLTLIATDENLAEPADLISRFRVVTTPTVIVQVDGQELGRIEEDPEVSMEADLAAILVGPERTGR